MERVFGEYFVKCKVLAAPEESKGGAEAGEQAAFYPYEKVSVEDTLVKTNTSHVAVFFTAEYCPPC